MRQPIFFLGHGSPMRALQKDFFSESLYQAGQRLKDIKAVLVISAHWQTHGTFITSAENPKQIYDMYGFPDELYQLKYQAKGDPILANRILTQFPELKISKDEGQWGIDHGTWSVLVHMFPQAEIPVLQLSLDIDKDPTFFYALGAQLKSLRDEGILILGSGNIVHNLRKIEWNSNRGAIWADEFDQWVLEKIQSGSMNELVNKFRESQAGKLSVPTLDHYLPLLVILGAADSGDSLEIVYQGLELGAISMTSLRFG